MTKIAYPELPNINRVELLEILNKGRLREHLVAHALFDEETLDSWIAQKCVVDSSVGCRVRGITIDNAVAGWCGIQLENGAFELAVVLDEAYWGLGRAVFRDMMRWSAELGHTVVVLHLLNTRSEYKFLSKMALRVYESTMFGQKYTSYELSVPTA